MQNLGKLRSFLEVDRLSVCQLLPDRVKVQVVAESIHERSLPPLASSRFSMNTLLPIPCEQVFQFKKGVMVNAGRKTAFQFPLFELDGSILKPNQMLHLTDDSPTLQGLRQMGVAYSCILPIFEERSPWGLMMAHHSEETFLSTRKLGTMVMLADQLSLGFVQETLDRERQIKVEQDRVLTQVAGLLQSASVPAFQEAMNATILAFQGSGGRLCMRDPGQGEPKDFGDCLNASASEIKAYTYGPQLESKVAGDRALIEHYRRWQMDFPSDSSPVWIVPALHQTPGLESLLPLFEPTPINSFVFIPFFHRHQMLGFLCIFRNSAIASTVPRPTGGMARSEAELAEKLGEQFARAIYEDELSQRAESAAIQLNTELEQQSSHLEQVTKQQESLAEMLVQVQTSTDLEVTLRETIKALCLALKAERVAIYRFSADWGGRFLDEFGYSTPQWIRAFKLGANTIWNDTYLQDTQGGRFRHNEVLIVDDIYQADLSSCHRDIYEQFQIKAFATAPVFTGKRLWGIMGAYQHSQPRHWRPTDVKFLTQTSSTVGLAIQRTELMNLAPGKELRYPSLIGEFNSASEASEQNSN